MMLATEAAHRTANRARIAAMACGMVRKHAISGIKMTPSEQRPLEVACPIANLAPIAATASFRVRMNDATMAPRTARLQAYVPSRA